MFERLKGGDLFKIDPVKKYSADYNTCTQAAQQDLRTNARPELTAYLDGIDPYNTIILGYPNYWGTCPVPVLPSLRNTIFPARQFFPSVPTKAAEWILLYGISRNAVS